MISQSAEYALRAVIVLARSPDRSLTTQAISKETRVSAGYLAKMMQTLARADIVSARRGVHGGYRLAVPADKLSVLQVVRAIDPSRRITRCPLSLASHTCPCPLHKRLDDAAATMDIAFEKTSIAELLEGPIQTMVEASSPPGPDVPRFATPPNATGPFGRATP